MLNENWKNFETAYHIRANKYAGGKYLSLNRKHKGVIGYLIKAINRLENKDISFCDAGCGNGIYLKYLKDEFQNIKLSGFDFSKTIVDIAKKNTGVENVKVGNLEEIPFGNNQFDLVLCAQVIEHLLDDKKGMAELYRILKPGGYLIFSTDNKANYITKILNIPFKIISFPFALLKKIFYKKDYFPHRDYTIKEFADLIAAQNFAMEELATFRFSAPYPFYKLKIFRSLMDAFEKFTSKRGLLKNNGDIVIAICTKEIGTAAE